MWGKREGRGEPQRRVERKAQRAHAAREGSKDRGPKENRTKGGGTRSQGSTPRE